MRHGIIVVVCVGSACQTVQPSLHYSDITCSLDVHTQEPTNQCNIYSHTHTYNLKLHADIYNHPHIHAAYQVFRSSVFMNLLYTFQHASGRCQEVVNTSSLAVFTASIGCWLFTTVYLSCYFLYKEGLHNNLVIYQHCIFSESSTCICSWCFISTCIYI